MQGFLKYHIPVWVRRGVTMAPALVIIMAGLDPMRSLVLSQVVLSFGLPFAVIPLVWFTSRRGLMGVLANRRPTTAAACVVAALILALNVFLLYRLLLGD
jgi:manganese transport protein